MTDLARLAAAYDHGEREITPAPSLGGRRTPRVQLATLLHTVVDVVRIPSGRAAFLRRQDGALVVSESLTIDGECFEPFPAKELPWLLPDADDVLRAERDLNARELFEGLRTAIATAAVLPDDRWADLLAGWVLLTYRAEDVHYLPEILIHGVPERGKSRLAKALVYAAWRGFVAPGLREAVLLRWRDYHRATLCLDLEDVGKQSLRAGVEDLLLASFERGGIVARVLWPERGPGRDMKHFRVYGPTVITTNVAPRADSALMTRCIPLVLPEAGGRRFGPPPTPEDGLPFRARCVAWRARTLGASLPELEPPVRRRLGDICKPVLQVVSVVAPERLGAVADLIRALATEITTRRGESLEGAVVTALVDLRLEAGSGHLSLKRVREKVNAARDAKEGVSGQLVGRLLRNLGLTVVPKHAGERFVRWDSGAIEKIAVTFGVTSGDAHHVHQPSPAQVVATPYAGVHGELGDAAEGSSEADMRLALKVGA